MSFEDGNAFLIFYNYRYSPGMFRGRILMFLFSIRIENAGTSFSWRFRASELSTALKLVFLFASFWLGELNYFNELNKNYKHYIPPLKGQHKRAKCIHGHQTLILFHFEYLTSICLFFKPKVQFKFQPLVTWWFKCWCGIGERIFLEYPTR